MWLLDTIYSINAKLGNNSRVFERLKINSAIRFCLRLIANNLLPICYRISTPKFPKRNIPVVISLTSFPVRISKVWIVIEAMLRQNVKAEKIILWLSRDQFSREIEDLPEELVAQTKRGLEIRFVDGDIRSHKKYYYVFREFTNKYVLTIDDDLLFPSTFIEDVYECVESHPNSVIANFGSRFVWNKTIGYIDRTNETIRSGETGRNLFFGSGGGTLFQPWKLMSYMDDIKTIRRLCPTADDIYLNSIARLAGMDVTFMKPSPLLSINNHDDVKLTDHNGNLYSPTSTNADQLRALVEYDMTKWGKNPFDVNF